MPGINGMEVAQKVRKKNTEGVIVFITNVAQYAIEGYSVGALDYVLKPIKEKVFMVKLGKYPSLSI